MQVLTLKYLRTNTHQGYVSAPHECDMMVHEMNGLKLLEVETYTRILASLLKRYQLTLASILLAGINFCSSNTVCTTVLSKS